MLTKFTTDPVRACYGIWIVWAISWWLAAAWSSRAKSRAGVAQELPYRLITIVGYIFLFGVQNQRQHWPFRLWTLPIGAAWAMPIICLVGFGFAWWARIHLGQLWSAFVTRKSDHHIIDTGPYGIVRHPIYTGIILATIAVAIVKGTLFAVVGALIAVLGYWIKAQLEEGFLREQLGADVYDSYRRRVPMLVPFGRV